MRLRLRTAAILILTALTSSALLIGTAHAEEPRRTCFIFCRVSAPPPPPAPVVAEPVAPPVTPSPPAVPVAPQPPTVTTTPQLSASGLLKVMNAHRATHGARPLRMDAGLTSVALAHTRRMAATNRLYHNDSLFTRATHQALGIASLGENVVVEIGVLAGHQAFLASPGHHRNLDRPEWVLVGIAIVRDGRGQYWMTHNFGTARRGAAPVAATIPRYRPSAGNDLPAAPIRAAVGAVVRPTAKVTSAVTRPAPQSGAAATTMRKPRSTAGIATPSELSRDRELATSAASLHGRVDTATRNTGAAAAGLFAGVLLALIARQSYVTAAVRSRAARRAEPATRNLR